MSHFIPTNQIKNDVILASQDKGVADIQMLNIIEVATIALKFY